MTRMKKRAAAEPTLICKKKMKVREGEKEEGREGALRAKEG